MIRVDCRRCTNCTGEECKLYGDDPVKAAKNCAHDHFVNYIPRERKKPKKNMTEDELAQEAIAGKWGNGADRKERLTAAGYDYHEVQTLVNKMLKK